jgi:hypothetical protein
LNQVSKAWPHRFFFFLDNHQEYIKKVIKLIVKVKYRKKKEQILKNKNKIDLLQKKKKVWPQRFISLLTDNDFK